VTGANRGIGHEICRQLAAHGLDVVQTGRDLAATEHAAAELGTRPMRLDVTDPASVDECARRLADDGVAVDVLVNNAGVYPTMPLLDVSEAVLLDSLQVNMIGAFRTTMAFLPGMIARRYGRIVNVSSGGGAMTDNIPSPPAYGVAKAALNALTLVTYDAAPSTVKVNALCPGWVRTRMGGGAAPRGVDEGADTAVWLATLPADGPNGGFFRDRKPIAW
jgi:NAD(P)-dependent dehydrogenase (short-subunit alcohol dehydrogenase family)